MTFAAAPWLMNLAAVPESAKPTRSFLAAKSFMLPLDPRPSIKFRSIPSAA